MPVVAVGAAVYAGSSIAAAGGLAAFAATAGTWAAIGAVGAITAAVGVVTGNETLTRVGAIAGLAGGIGALAQNSGWFTASELAKTGTDAAAQAATSTAAETGSIASAVDAAAPGVANPAANLAGTATETAATTTAASTAGNTAGLINQPALTPLAVTDVGSMGQVASVTAGGSGAVAGAGGVVDTIKNLGGFLKDNKELAAIGANFIGGMFDEKKEAEAEYLKGRTANERSQINMLEQQAANAKSVPDISNLQVNPSANVYGTNPKTYKPVRVGLINS